MIVCVCRRISDRDIARAVREGCATFDQLQDELAVATACGACHDCAQQTFRQHAAQVGAGTATIRIACAGATASASAACHAAAPPSHARHAAVPA